MQSQRTICPDCGGPKGPRASRCRTCSNHLKNADARALLPPPNPSGLCMCGCGQKTGLAVKTQSSMGHIQGLPVRYLVGHHKRKHPPISYQVDPETGCLPVFLPLSKRRISSPVWPASDFFDKAPLHLFAKPAWVKDAGQATVAVVF